MSNAIFPNPSNFPDKGAVSISSYHLRKLRHVRSNNLSRATNSHKAQQDSSLELSHHATRDYGVVMVVGVGVCVCIKQEKKMGMHLGRG